MNGWSQYRSVQPAQPAPMGGIRPVRPGMGDADFVGPVQQVSSSTGGAISSALIGSLTSLGVSAAIAGVTFGISKWREGVARRAASTQIVNEAEPYLQQNVAQYLSSPRTESDQAQAVQNFYAVWNQVVEKCNQVGGNAGAACINDRKEGAITPWGGPNWFERYLDPIRDDPDVQPNAQPGTSVVYDEASGQYVTVQSGLSLPGFGNMPSWALAIGVAAVGFMMFGGSK